MDNSFITDRGLLQNLEYLYMNILRLMMDTSHFSLQQGKVVQPLQKACKRPRVQSVMETHHIKQSLGKNEDHQLRPHLSLTLFFLPWKANSFLVRFNSIFCSNLNSSHPPSNACPHSQNEQIPYQRFWQLLIYSLHCLNHIKYQLLFYLFCLDPLNTRFFYG